MRIQIGLCAVGLSLGCSASASADLITATFQREFVGQFYSTYVESGIAFSSVGGAGVSFLNNALTSDIGLFEATAGAAFAVRAELPGLADSVTVRFFLAQDDVVSMTAYDSQGSVVDFVSQAGSGTPFDYLTLTVEAPAIARIEWIGSTDTLLVAGQLDANIIPAPGVTAIGVLACFGAPRRRRP